MRPDKPTVPVAYRFKRAASCSERSKTPTLTRPAFAAFLAAADAAIACTELESELNSPCTSWTTGRSF